MTNGLLPCPFCSSEKIYDNTVSNEYGDFPSNYCHKCLSSSPIWNTRASGWVSVAERLPENNTLCFVFLDDGHDINGIFKGFYQTASFSNGIFWSRCIEEIPKYWMYIPELPNPPKEPT